MRSRRAHAAGVLPFLILLSCYLVILSKIIR
ncbi:DUF2933 domain-containing protein [Erwinia tracheiphila]|uniref:DUF2933 domain-containing protein n=1 Tax=Erwinia tracheiphila TaxID=65700 RepID=A0A345CZA8_9GAMM|nr:DUF2933 domain-containing protein [Erwinia tracheiphila]